MTDLVIGIDPDAVKHGLAVYADRKLVSLHNFDLLDLIEFIEPHCGLGKPVIALENVMANKFVYRRNRKPTKAQESRVAMSIGRVQQAQVELERLLDKKLGLKPILFTPQSGNWATNETMFQRMTGWDKRSNQDQRAAAFFGWLAINRRP